MSRGPLSPLLLFVLSPMDRRFFAVTEYFLTDDITNISCCYGPGANASSTLPAVPP